MPAPKRVTDEVIAEWTRLRTERNLSYREIVEARPGFSPSTVAEYIGDGKRIGSRYAARNAIPDEVLVEMKRLRAEPHNCSYDFLAEQFGLTQRDVRKLVGDERRVKPSPLPDTPRIKQLRESARAWKQANRERVRANARQRIAARQWKRNGSPPPKNGRACACATPLGAEGEPCGWCSYLIRADAA